MTDAGGYGYNTGGFVSTSRAVVMMEIGDSLLDGHYTIKQKLGSGASGIAYQARHNETGADVTIKTVPREVTDDTTELSDFRVVRPFDLTYVKV